MQRRSLLQAGTTLAAAAASNALLWAPHATSASPEVGHNAYFAALNNLLKRDGPGRPVLIVDVNRMQHNIDLVAASVGKKKTWRVVVKSLPSVPLLQQVMTRARSNALMVFHQPFLNRIADAFPQADTLLGKPMPVAAARTFYDNLRNARFNPATQVQWLIDSHERLLQYQALAKELGIRLQLNIEVDVGLHRGGLSEPAALTALLKTIQADPQHLSLSGLMGYEAHLTGLKADLSHPAVTSALGTYQGFVDAIRAAGLPLDNLTFNGAGSHTLNIYRDDHTFNDLAAGSGIVMPSDFDTFHLAQHQPALFIATPILKRYTSNRFMQDPPANMAQIYYIYGGYWKANMVSPDNVGEPIYESTNQSPISTGANVNLKVDDYMFLRPTQSEFVMLQFGDLLAVKDGKLADRWPVFHQTG